MRRLGAQTMPPGLENTLNDVREVDFFSQFQSSSAIKDIIPGCEVKTEYQVEECSWRVSSVDYVKQLLVLRDGEETKGLQSWNEVLKLIQDAEDQYMGKAENNWFRKNLRQGENVAAVLKDLTEMIPEEYGLGVLRGGLSMLFTAWRGRIQNREKIFRVLSDIPTVLCVAFQKWRFFKSDAQLWDAIKRLYDDSIDAIRSLIEILTPSSGSLAVSLRRHLSKMLPEREAGKIEQILEAVNAAVANVENHIQRLDRTRAAETHFHAQVTHLKTDEIKETLKGTNELVTAGNMQTQEAIRDGGKHMEHLIESKFDDLRQEVEKKMLGGLGLIPQHMEYMQWVENCITSLFLVAGEERYKRSLQPPITVFEPITHQHTTVLPTERLIELMGVHSLSPYQDRDLVLRKGHTMSPLFLGRGRFLLAAPRFQQLLSALTPDFLLVDGHCQHECDGKVSPISVFCASLAATLAHNPAFMVLPFFAGQHSFFDSDPARGPRGLMRSLICQVLSYPNQPSPCLDWIRDQAMQDIADGKIDALCWVFKELLKRVVNVSTILCIVDNVSDFERKYEGWDQELNTVFDWFRLVPTELCAGVNFKLLMTSAGKSTQLIWKTGPSERLSLVAGNVMNAGKSEWAMARNISESVPSQAPYWHEGHGY